MRETYDRSCSYLSLTQGLIVSYYFGQSPDVWESLNLILDQISKCERQQVFYFFFLSPYFPFQLRVLLGPSKKVGEGAWGGERRGREWERWIEREGKGEAKREKEINWERERNSPVTAFSQPTGLGPVARGSGKRSHHLQTIIQCPRLDRLSAPVTRPVSVTNSNKHPKLITPLPLNPTAIFLLLFL